MNTMRLNSINNGLAMLHKQLEYAKDELLIKNLLQRIYNLVIERKELNG